MWWIIAVRRVLEGYVVDFHRDSFSEHRPGTIIYKVRFNNSVLTTDIFRDLYSAFQVKRYEKYYCFICGKNELINYIYNLLNGQRPFTDVSEIEYTYFVTDYVDFICYSDIQSIAFDKTHGYYLRKNAITWTPLSLAELAAEQLPTIEKAIKSLKDDFAVADDLQIEFDLDVLFEDIKLANKTQFKFATPEYHEHIVQSSKSNQSFVFNAQTSQFYLFNSTSLVVTNASIERKCFDVEDKITVNIVENIIDVFIGIGRRKILKEILHGMLIKKSEKTNIIYDYGSHYITKWLLNAAECLLSPSDYATDPEQINPAHRLIVTDDANSVEKYTKAGIKNIVVRVEGGDSCNVTKASMYFKINSRHIVKKSMTFHTFCENLFKRNDLFQTEFILWSVL